MRAIFNRSTDPYFNLASDEYLLRSTDGDAFMLWRNSPAVIIGKNQNAWAQVDRDFADRNGIAVVRRITGGGAVFHDLGNVNFSIVSPAPDGEKLNFDRFTEPMIRALRRFGVDAERDGRNDIVAKGVKISGNAECVVKNDLGRDAILHHGTLLFSADLSRLSGALTPDEEKYKSRGIKSVSSRVGNIRDLGGYAGPDTVEGFMTALMAEISPDGFEGFSEDEILKISRLRDEKFKTWEWNWGASPAHETSKKIRFPFGTVEASYTCREGKIESVKMTGDFFGSRDVSFLEAALLGAKLKEDGILEKLTSDLAASCIHGASPEDIVKLFL